MEAVIIITLIIGAIVFGIGAWVGKIEHDLWIESKKREGK